MFNELHHHDRKTLPPPVFERSRRQYIYLFLGLIFGEWAFAHTDVSQNSPLIRAALVVVWIVIAITTAVSAATHKKRWRARIESVNHEVCPECGYTFKGLPDPHTCPECGVPYRLAAIRPRWMEILQ